MDDQTWGILFATLLYRKLTKKPGTLVQILITGSEHYHCLVYILHPDDTRPCYWRSHEFGILTFFCLRLAGLLTVVPEAERPEDVEGFLYKPVAAGLL